MIFVTYAELRGNPPHMRYLLRRIRQRFPLCPVLVGFWDADDALLGDSAAQEMAGDRFASSLHDAVSKCLDEARKVQQPRSEDDLAAGAATRICQRSGGAVTRTVQDLTLPFRLYDGDAELA